MTIVVGFATNDHAVIAADKRRTRFIGDPPVRQYYDDVTKVYQLTHNFLIGFSGIFYPTVNNQYFTDVAAQIINRIPIKDTDCIEDVAYQISKQIARMIRGGIDPKVVELQFMIAGKTKEGVFGLSRVSHLEAFRPITQIAAESSFTWSAIIPDYSPSDWIEQQRNSMHNPTLEELEGIARYVVETGAQVDPLISPEYDLLTMTLA